MVAIITISPSTNEVICSRSSATLQEANDVIQRSYTAFRSFSKLPLSSRRAMVVRALSLIQERKLALGVELSQQMGRPVEYSHKEIETMQKRADYLLDIAEEALADIPGRSEKGLERWIKRVPVGPTLVIFAWNVSDPPSTDHGEDIRTEGANEN